MTPKEAVLAGYSQPWHLCYASNNRQATAIEIARGLAKDWDGPLKFRGDVAPYLQQKTAALAGYLDKTAADPNKQLAERFDALLAQQPRLEGFRDRVYIDSKQIPTIGYGINLQDTGNLARLRALFGDAKTQGWGTGQPMTQAEAGRFVQERALHDDIPALRRAIPDFDTMPMDARLGMLSAHWNSPKLIGPNLRGFLKAKNYPAAVGEVAYGHSSNLPGHAWRRNYEAGLLGKAFGVTPQLTEEVDPVKRTALYNGYMQGLKPVDVKQ